MRLRMGAAVVDEDAEKLVEHRAVDVRPPVQARQYRQGFEQGIVRLVARMGAGLGDLP